MQFIRSYMTRTEVRHSSCLDDNRGLRQSIQHCSMHIFGCLNWQKFTAWRGRQRCRS